MTNDIKTQEDTIGRIRMYIEEAESLSNVIIDSLMSATSTEGVSDAVNVLSILSGRLNDIKNKLSAYIEDCFQPQDGVDCL